MCFSPVTVSCVIVLRPSWKEGRGEILPLPFNLASHLLSFFLGISSAWVFNLFIYLFK